jgi:hypothetical protein
VQITAQSTEQPVEQSWPWRIPPGKNGKAWLTAQKRKKVEAKAHELAAELSGPPARWQWELLLEVADEILRPIPKDVEQRIRRRNAIGKLMKQAGLSGGSKRDESSELAKLWREGNAP